jgi:hypothetical protein
MGSYRSDDEALIGLARQLTDAYGEARTREDQDYACESIDQFLSEFKGSAPSEALLAILDLPLTAETYPLVDEAQVALASRGPGVVELLLEAVLGDVYDPDGSAPERAAETLDQMDPRDAALGLTEVLCGRGRDQLKGAAVDGLVALGGLAEPDLVATLDDSRGGDWARAALEQIRYAQEHPGVEDGDLEDEELEDGEFEEREVEAAGDEEADEEEGEAGDDLTDAGGEDDSAAEAGEGDDDAAADEDEVVNDDAREPGLEAAGDEDVSDQAVAGFAGPADEPAGAGLPGTAAEHPATGAPEAQPGAGPDLGLVDDAYEDFLRRYEQDAGGEAPSP